MCNQRRMFNRSSVVVRFCWCTCKDGETEERLQDAAGSQHDARALRFCHDLFAIDPMEGCIWPGVSAHVSLVWTLSRFVTQAMYHLATWLFIQNGIVELCGFVHGNDQHKDLLQAASL